MLPASKAFKKVLTVTGFLKNPPKEDGLFGYSYRSYYRFYGDYARNIKSRSH